MDTNPNQPGNFWLDYSHAQRVAKTVDRASQLLADAMGEDIDADVAEALASHLLKFVADADKSAVHDLIR